MMSVEKSITNCLDQETVDEQQLQLQGEFEDLLSSLQETERQLYPLLSRRGQADAVQRVRRHNKQAIYQQIAGARYQDVRVSLSWSKDVLIEAYIEIQQSYLQSRWNTIWRQLCEILGWDYQMMER